MHSFCINMKFLAFIALCAITSAHDISQLKVPLYADPRRAAELSCHFKMDEQKLHSVKWYRDTNEIFRYNPQQQPAIRLFNITDVMVQGGECQPDFCIVRVMPPPISTRAAYTCEVSTEGPRFQIARKTKHMTVVAMPEAGPMIIGAQKVLKPGDQIFLNCSSDFSLPPAEINWYIDEELQKPEAWQKTEVTGHQPGGLRRSWRVLRLRVPSTASGAMRVRCESILEVEPPVIRDVDTIITIHSRTLLSKYVSNNNSDRLRVTTVASTSSSDGDSSDGRSDAVVDGDFAIDARRGNGSGTKVVNTVVLIVSIIILLTFNEISKFTSL